MTIKLGQTIKDNITGFSGLVTARCEYITGCNQVLIQPRVKADGEFVDPRWLDEDRIEVLDVPVVALHVVNPGFGKPAPVR